MTDASEATSSSDARPAATPPANDARSSVPSADRAVKAGIWAVINYGGSQAIRLASNLVLTRLLFAEAFGMMALIVVFLTGLALFSDTGIHRAIVQSKRGEDPLYLDTAWTIGLVRGLVLWLVSCACAVPLARLYDAPMLVSLVPVMGLTALVQGMASTKLFTQNRKLAQRSLAIVEIGGQAIGTIVMIVCAFIWRSIWALAIGSVVVSIARTVLSHLVLPGERNRFRFNRSDAQEMFQIGRWLFLSTALTFLASQSDRLIFGKLVSLETLGVYNIALTLALMPLTVLSQLMWNVLFPVISRAFEKGDDPNPPFLKARAPILIVGGVMTSGMVAAGPFIIDALYDDRYSEAGWMLRLLALSGWLQALQTTLTTAVLARGQAAAMALTNAIKLAALLGSVWLGHRLAGFQGAVLGLIAMEIIGMVAISIGGRWSGIRTSKQDAWLTLRVAVASAAGVACATLLRPVLPDGFFGAVLGAFAVVTVTSMFWLAGVGEHIRSLRSAVKPSS